MRLHGKTALITGAARGIGLEFARAYLAEGATVTLADINADAVARAAVALGPRAHALQMDVTQQDSIDAGFADAVRFTAPERDALSVMGLAGDIDRTGLRKRYSELVRRYHPDRNGGDRRHEGRLQRVVEAYNLLKGAAAFA